MGELYNGVDMDHPAIRAAVHNMVKNGENKKQIMKVVGIPEEVADKHIASAPKS